VTVAKLTYVINVWHLRLIFDKKLLSQNSLKKSKQQSKIWRKISWNHGAQSKKTSSKDLASTYALSNKNTATREVYQSANEPTSSFRFYEEERFS
jgi:hypothetical protein